MFVRDSVSVLLQEAIDFVSNVQGVMSDGKRGLAEARLLVHLLVLGLWKNLSVQFLEERGIRARWHPRFFIQQRKNAEFAFDDIDARLVIGEIDELPLDFFFDIFLLLEFEDVRIELRDPSVYG